MPLSIAQPRMLVASIMLIAATILAACDDVSPEKHIAAARQHLERGDRKAATIEIKNALQKKNDNTEARLLLGQVLLESGDARGAELELRKARDQGVSPDQVMPLLLRAYAATGQFKILLDEGRKVQPADPLAFASVQNSIAMAMASTGDLAGAQKAIEQALGKKADFTPALLTRARLNGSAGNADGALADVEKVIQQQPRDAEAWKFKGDLQMVRNERTDAMASYRKAVEFRPDYVIARFAVISNLMGQASQDEAAKEFDALVSVAKGHPLTQLAGAQIAFARKDFKSAREYAQLLLRMAPDNPVALTQSGAIEFSLKSYAQAETQLAQALKADPRSLPARRWLALTYLASEQPAKAVEALKPILESINDDANLLMLAGEAYMRNGDAVRAEEFFTAATKLDPADARKQTSLALTRLAKGEADAAFGALEKISAGDTGTSADMALIANHLRRGEVDKGLIAIDNLQKKLPDNPLPHEMRGRLLLAKRDAAGARASFGKALALNPAYFPAVAGLAALDMQDKKPAEAIKRFEALVAADPKNAQAYLAIAGVRAQMGATVEEAAALIAQAVAARPDETAPRAALVDLHMRARDYRKAITAAQDGIAALPDRPELYDLLGQAQQASGELNQALATYNKQVALQPGAVRPYLRMAEINVAAKKPEAAAQNLRQALEIKPDLVEAQRGLIMLDLQASKGKNALALARGVQKQRPKEAIGHLLEGDIHASQKAWPEAATAYRAGLNLTPSTEMAVKLHGALLAGNNTAEAERMAAAWQKEQPRDYGFQMHLGEAALARNDLQGASQRFRDLLGAMPENPVLLNNLAWTAGRLKAPDAISLAEKANQVAPNQPAFMDTLGMLLLEKGDVARANELLAKAVELAPQAHAIRLNQARALIKAGKKREARLVLEELAALGDKFPARAEIEKIAQDL